MKALRPYHLIILFSFAILGSRTHAQSVNDSSVTFTSPIVEVKDSTKSRVRDPKKAALYSALMPGGGQIYNRKYWKLPIVYGAMGTALYFYFDNRNYYVKYKAAYINDLKVEAGEPGYTTLSEDGQRGVPTTRLRQAADEGRSNMEYAMLGCLAVYVLQIVDASVDAHLSSFDVSDDLTLHWNPTIVPAQNQQLVTGISLKFRF